MEGRDEPALPDLCSGAPAAPVGSARACRAKPSEPSVADIAGAPQPTATQRHETILPDQQVRRRPAGEPGMKAGGRDSRIVGIARWRVAPDDARADSPLRR